MTFDKRCSKSIGHQFGRIAPQPSPSCMVAMNQGHGNWLSSSLFCLLNQMFAPYHLHTEPGVEAVTRQMATCGRLT